MDHMLSITNKASEKVKEDFIYRVLGKLRGMDEYQDMTNSEENTNSSFEV